MLLSPGSVELTKVNYYSSDERQQIYSISGQIERKRTDKSKIIKKNIFGHKWVLKVNEATRTTPKKKCNIKVFAYSLVFCCILLAISSGIYFTIEAKFKDKKTNEKNVNSTKVYFKNSTESTPEKMSTSSNAVKMFNNISLTSTSMHMETTPKYAEESICDNCHFEGSVCLKFNETTKPACVKVKDKKDPTGCGGHCKINLEHCKSLDVKHKVFQCVKNKKTLTCSNNHFNCGNMCIPIEKRCDGIVHCLNRVDEKDCPCDLKTHFQCGDATSCLDAKKRCNGVIECWDRTDEIGCNLHGCDLTKQLPCTNGQCISKEHFCDGTAQCLDGSDEPSGCSR